MLDALAKAVLEATRSHHRKKGRVEGQSREGWLVLSEIFYPGWRATIDGSPANVYRANYLFRAIPLPAGPHRIELSFMPDSFLVGATISLGATLFLVLVAVMTKRLEQSDTSTGRRRVDESTSELAQRLR